MIYKGVLLYFQSQYLHNENFKLKLSFLEEYIQVILKTLWWTHLCGLWCAMPKHQYHNFLGLRFGHVQLEPFSQASK